LLDLRLSGTMVAPHGRQKCVRQRKSSRQFNGISPVDRLQRHGHEKQTDIEDQNQILKDHSQKNARDGASTIRSNQRLVAAGDRPILPPHTINRDSIRMT